MAEEKKQHHCDCGCDHDHHDHDCTCDHDGDCDCGCEHDDVVVLQDENGNDVAFHYITTLEHEGKEYVYLQSADEEDDNLAVEIFELQTVEEDGELFDTLLPIDDDLYEIMYEKLMFELANGSDDEEE
ncbi:MAG: DUF1292 domain-containing protein [Clostridia bacterium]|nr:DUF1292 domain-containing protein [Clostridia bacterium]MBQ2913947.1 DUF1292 domain-containing protein [Clostridia bacterium]MBQ3042313.1 DUF1292 domain-containing protein [Clostridia bacterium]MBQ4272024.1 DUF1292 domain-containing protein [Clostridia bacterium]